MIRVSASSIFTVFALLLVAAGCSQSEDFAPSREAVAQELRDPSSAEFRNEAIRTLWTKGGQRITMYCAEVNAANAFGGKTGFKPVSRVLDQVNLNENVKHIYEVGAVWIYEGGPRPGFYLDCIRPDTERDDANFGKAIAWFGEFGEADKAEIDKMAPVLSNRMAP